MYEKPRVNVKVERGSTFTFTRGFSYITSISIYARKASSSLRPYARKNYATVEIHLKTHVSSSFPGPLIGLPVSYSFNFPNGNLVRT